jgi:hypothetical protein
VVDSNATSPLASSARPDFLRMSDANMVTSPRVNRAEMGLYGHCG